MRKYVTFFTVFFCVATGTAIAQYTQPISVTKFNRFVSRATVTAAVYVKDSATFGHPNLPELLLQKLQAGRVKTFLPVEFGLAEEDSIKFLSRQEVAQFFSGPDTLPGLPPQMPADLTQTFLGQQLTASPVELNEILFVESGRPYLTVNRFSLTKEIITPSGIDLGRGEVLSFGRNSDAHPKFRTQRATCLGTVTRSFAADSFPEHDRLKQMFGSNIITSLWPAMRSGKTKGFYNGAQIAAQDLEGLEIPGARVSVPVYDSLGNLNGTHMYRAPLDPASFDRVSITEKWYFDNRKNILICEIPEAQIFLKAQSSDRQDLRASSLRLVF